MGEIPEEGLNGSGGFCGHMDIAWDLGVVVVIWILHGI